MLTLLGLGLTGCIRRAVFDGNIDATLRGSEAVNTLQDFEVARAVGRAGLAQLEGLHYLVPYNNNALLLLTRGWGGATFAFTEDEWEMARMGNDRQLEAYHLQRTTAGFIRARFYGIELLKRHADGFEEARRNQPLIKAWLAENFKDPDQAEMLLWIGYGWVSHVGSAKTPEVIGDLHVGVEIVKRSVELDDTIRHATGHTILGAYHARTAMAELDQSKEHFEAALKINGGKYLLTELNYASRYYCAKSDRKNYERLLKKVLKAGDVLPDARLQNTIAKRRARRYLENKIFQEECGFLS